MDLDNQGLMEKYVHLVNPLVLIVLQTKINISFVLEQVYTILKMRNVYVNKVI